MSTPAQQLLGKLRIFADITAARFQPNANGRHGDQAQRRGQIGGFTTNLGAHRPLPARYDDAPHPPARYTHRALVKRSALARRYTRSAGRRLTSVIPPGSTATAAAWADKAASYMAEHSQTRRASLLRPG